jgi:hypothetical protein
MSLDFYAASSVRGVIEKGLRQIHSEQNPDWEVEDVFETCEDGKAHVLMDPTWSAEGFVIVQSVPIPFSTESKLLLWIAFDPQQGSAARFAAELEELALETNHSQIEILTPHSGLVNLAQQFGYTMRYVTLNKKLERKCQAVEANQKNENRN